jgi:two-component system, NtrC family, sensor histidine kinase HupT/HoxJ
MNLAVFGNLGFVLICLVLFFIAFIFRLVMKMKGKNQIHYAFIALMVTVFIWAIGSIILAYNFLTGIEVKLWVVGVAYTGLILTPVTVLYIGLIFAKTKIRITWKQSVFLLIPLLSIAMVFTNNYHHLFYKYLVYEDMTKSTALGGYFIIHTIYSYLCILVGSGYLVYFSSKNAGFFSRQSIFILLGILSTTGYNILLTAQIINGYFHTNVIAFFFTFLFFYLAIIRFDFLNIVPIALQKVVDHISDSFLVIDKDNYIIDYNKTFGDTFGSMMKIFRKDNLDDFIGHEAFSDELSDLLTLFREAVAKRVLTSFEKTLMIDGEVKYFSIEITPLYNQKIYLSTIVLMKDITQVKRALETIQKNNEVLMEKERLASLGQLIGGIAHNLKTPIMSISGGIEGLKDLIDEYDSSIGDPDVTNDDHHGIAKEMSAWIVKIKPYCSYMSDIISTVKGQASQFNTSRIMTFTLDELVKRVDLLMKHELKRYHCSLEISYETNQLIEMKGDVNSLVQIFDNLIINSIYSYNGREGTIELFIREEGSYVVFALKDHGNGIPLSIQERLFKEMVTTKGTGGTGLGLYMSCATIKGKFNGNMWFESTPGLGTTFYISIPCVQIARNQISAGQTA